MIKVFAIVCLCGVLFVGAQGQTDAPSVAVRGHHRALRQMPGGNMMPGGDMMSGGGMGGGNPGNLGMQGLGNIPDPTAWVAKGQEVIGQFVKGRRRRQAPNQKMPNPDGMPMPPMPKVN